MYLAKATSKNQFKLPFLVVEKTAFVMFLHAIWCFHKFHFDRYLLTFDNAKLAAPPPLNLATKKRWTLQFVLLKTYFFVQWCNTKNHNWHGWSVWDDNKNFIKNNVTQGKYSSLPPKYAPVWVRIPVKYALFGKKK